MRCVDLFSGCGGMSRGFSDAKFEIVAAFENWEAAIKCYKMNYNHPVYSMDLNQWQKTVDILNNLGCEIIIGGPPCQDFSHAGNRIEGKRAQLTISFAHIIAAIKPKYFVMENVERVFTSKAYYEARKIFKNAGYGLTERILNASYCGVPQNRKRFFCIGGLNKDDGFIDGVLAANLSELPMSVKEYLGNKTNIEYYYRHPRSYNRRGVFSVYEPAPTMRGSNRPLPPDYKKHEQDRIDPSTGVRALTFREWAQIQTFPDNYLWLDSSTINNQLIGNAVPVKLSYYVAKCIVDYTSNNYNTRDVGFVEWLKKEKIYTNRAAGDVLSRVRRIMRITSHYSEILLYEGNNIVETLGRTEEFISCTKSVKSQLKRAQSLYSEYLATCK